MQRKELFHLYKYSQVKYLVSIIRMSMPQIPDLLFLLHSGIESQQSETIASAVVVS